jgi:CubicO group peptidase (beta-lactamase class C family)
MQIGLTLALAAALSSNTSAPAVKEHDMELPSLEAAIEAGDYPQTTSVLVQSEDGVLYERYFDNGAPDRLNDTRSATKTLVAMAVGKAIEEGYLKSLNDPIGPLFDNELASESPIRAITFADLITMTSMLHCDDNNDTPGNEENMYPEQSWTAFTLGLPLQPNWERASDGLGSWRYCTAGSFLTGQALERATGIPIDQYIQDRLLAPLGITEAQWDHSPSGEVQTGGGLELTSHSLGQLSLAIAGEGATGGVRILPASWVDEMTTRRRDSFLDMGYGYQMWVKTYDLPCGKVDAWFMAGNGGNHILSFKDKGLSVVVTRERYNTRDMHLGTMEMLEKHILPTVICAA